MRDEAQDTEAGEAKAPGKLMPVLVLAGSLLAGAAAGTLVLGPRLFAAPTAAADAAQHEAEAGGHGGKKKKHEAGAGLVTLENLVVNPANSGGTRFLLISVAFEAESESIAAELKAAEPRLRDRFVTLLSARSTAELSDLSTRDSIRADLLAAADALVPGVRRLYIPQFVLQ